jgi:cytochrome c-type biogenesis protein CcmH
MNRLLAVIGILALFAASTGAAKEATPMADDPVLEKRLMEMSAELRCLVCQNQSLADSDAPLAVDLRNEIRILMQDGQEDHEIIQYLVARYGDFVRFRPPFKSTTTLLWFGPPILIVLAGATWFAALRRRQTPPTTSLSSDEQTRLDHVLRDRANSSTAQKRN